MENKKINKLRKKIDLLDYQLLLILQKRFKAVIQIGKEKKKIGLSTFQPKRWQEVLSSRLKLAEKLKIEKSFLNRLLNLIHKESLRRQKTI